MLAICGRSLEPVTQRDQQIGLPVDGQNAFRVSDAVILHRSEPAPDRGLVTTQLIGDNPDADALKQAFSKIQIVFRCEGVGQLVKMINELILAVRQARRFDHGRGRQVDPV